jgi:Holliday junction DNA helicase RuvA
VQGVGYQLRISLPTFSLLEVGKKVKLHTHLQIREDAHTLFGFNDLAEKKLFLDLVSVSGVGANTAMIILSSMSAKEIQEAIVSENLRVIQGIKGIGVKTAQRLILELKDKIKKENAELGSTNPAQVGSLAKAEALQALIALGLAKPLAEKNLEAISKKMGDSLTVEEYIKYALRG